MTGSKFELLFVNDRSGPKEFACKIGLTCAAVCSGSGNESIVCRACGLLDFDIDTANLNRFACRHRNCHTIDELSAGGSSRSSDDLESCRVRACR